ncbi:MAG TPA: hypothetical protein VK151_05120 [Fluviicola sp.]|nr:hypothetical protein [Fluviicola sp.]
MKQTAFTAGKKWKIIGLLAVVAAIMVVFIRPFGAAEHPPVAFYYWKQAFALDQAQQSLLTSCETEELFVKFFDVTHDPSTGAAKPVSVITFDEQPALQIIPCVYIQNDVFKHPQPELAQKIYKLVQRTAVKNKLSISELQIDCDWSGTTRAAYFGFLRTLQQLDQKLKITCTIRLHQVKYQAETGVPPVKKGVLMCYNMDDLDAFDVENSILSVATLKKYISPTTDYPVELDLALPIYQWALVFRLGKLTLIANDISEKALHSSDYAEVKPNLFKARKNGYLNSSYICKGDLIRLETSSPETLSSIAEWLQESDMTFNRLILFHISQEHISHYNENSIQKIRRLIP